ncbi:AMP-dependent synthetase/ligase [Demetria terragena]|uniref:AMP-dependent synthetase/ligase n=1 Tax=Demetria terragena TaxID=63959 RepID=UPI0004779AFD|nr:AMP-dependent synthetase/ligase [Demetria terragena]
MQEFEVPPLVLPTTVGNLGLLPARNAAAEPRAIGYSRRTPDGDWVDVTHAEFGAEVEQLARGFMAAGIVPGARVALLCRTRYEWTLVDFALLAAGAIVVPIYPSASDEQVAWTVRDSEAVAAIVENADDAARISSARRTAPSLRDVWHIDGGGLADVLAGALEITDAEYRQRSTLADRETVATVIYTSGTTGHPKGVELTHGNFLGLTENAVERLREVVDVPQAATLLFLPLAHVYARLVQIVAVYSRARLGHVPTTDAVVDDLGSFQPTFILTVPGVLEAIYHRAEQAAVGDGRGRLFASAMRCAEAWSRALDTPKGPNSRLRLEHAAMERLVYRDLREQLGGRLMSALCGGAPLSERLGHVFRGIGVPILEGYGLTETTASATVNTPQLTRIGSVGLPLPGVSVRIADDGEILIHGIGTFAGYLNDEDSTARARTEDGWVHTGDLGRLDHNGYLTITGRRSDLLVTSNGTTIYPAALEAAVRAHPLISHCVVVGEGRPHLGALITVDAMLLSLWRDNRDLAHLTEENAASDDLVLAEVTRAIQDANAAPDAGAPIRSFRVLPVDLTTANGYLTPTDKVRRDLVMHDFADEVESLYEPDAITVT